MNTLPTLSAQSQRATRPPTAAARSAGAIARTLAAVVALAAVPLAGLGRFATPTAVSVPGEARFRHLSLFVNDSERVATWYQEMLGMALDARFTLRRRDGVQIAVVRLRLGSMLMHVSKVPNLLLRERGRDYQGWRHAALAVPDVDAVHGFG